MTHPQWWLMVVAFVLGLVLTFVLMIRRVEREVPVGISTGAASAPGLLDAESQSPTTTIPVTDESTMTIPLTDHSTTRIPVTDESTTTIPVADDATTKIPAAEVDTARSSGKRRGRWWALAGVVLVAAVAVAVTLTVASHHRGTSASSAPTSTAPISSVPPVSNSSLQSFLLPAQQVADIIGAAKMSEGASAPALLPDNSGLIAEKDCIGAWTPAQQGVYGHTGLTAAQVEILGADEVPQYHIVNQAVIAYPSADAAQKLVANQVRQWSACPGRTVSADTPANQPPRLFTFGPMTNTGGILSMTETSVDNAIWGCQRALAARGRVVIDIRACRPDVTNQGVDILDAIAAKIPQ